MKKRISLLLCALLIASALAACGSTQPAAQAPTADTQAAGNQSAVPTEAAEKHLNVGWHAKLETIDPCNSSWEGQRIGVAETLTRVNDDLQLIPWLADSWERVSDLEWSFHIRDDVQFSNGKACDAAAVQASLERTAAENKRSTTMLNIAGMKADGQTLTITTNAINAALPNNLADFVGSIFDVDSLDDTGAIYIGTGPFAISQWDHASKMELIANEFYWGGDVRLDSVTITTIEDGNAQAMALSGGEVDITFQLPTENVRQFVDNPNFTVTKRTGSRSQLLYFNFANELLSDARVRLAIAMATDRETFANAINKGDSEAATGIWPVSFSYGKVDGIDYDVEGAKALLAEAGFTDSDGDGILDKDGKALSFGIITYGSHGALLPTFAEALQDALKQIGIASEITLNDYAAHTDLLKSGNFDLAINSYIMAPVADPQYFADIMFKTDADYNYGGYSNAELDALVDEMDKEFDIAKREALAVQMQNIINEDCGWFTIGHLKFQSVSSVHVTNYSTLPTELYFLTADTDIQ